jgi:hypothetical protein
MNTKFAILLLSCLLLVCGCGGSPENEEKTIVGTWEWQEKANDGDIYTFAADGSYTIYSQRKVLQIEEGTYVYESGRIEYSIAKFYDGTKYRDLVDGDLSKYVTENCYFDGDTFSQRAMYRSDMPPSGFIGTWKSLGVEEFYKRNGSEDYCYQEFRSTTRIFDATSYTRTYDEYFEYDTNGVTTGTSRSHFVYTDVQYVDANNWSGLNGGTRTYIKSAVVQGDVVYHLFEYMKRVE